MAFSRVVTKTDRGSTAGIHLASTQDIVAHFMQAGKNLFGVSIRNGAGIHRAEDFIGKALDMLGFQAFGIHVNEALEIRIGMGFVHLHSQIEHIHGLVHAMHPAAENI